MSKEPTAQQVDSACLSYRHDFGLLNEDDKNQLRFQAKEWLIAWQKEGLDLPVKPWAFLEEGKEFRASFDDLFPGSRITCEVVWPHTDGNRVIYMQKTYRLPCWLEKGMKITTDSCSMGQVVDRMWFNLERCARRVLLTKYQHDTAKEMDHTLSLLQIDGWIVLIDGWIVDTEDECN